jgi:hypothetical protein
MSTDHFVKVFDVLDSGLNWTFPGTGLVFVALAIAMFAFPKLIKMLGIPYFSFQPRWQKIFPLLHSRIYDSVDDDCFCRSLFGARAP